MHVLGCLDADSCADGASKKNLSKTRRNDGVSPHKPNGTCSFLRRKWPNWKVRVLLESRFWCASVSLNVYLLVVKVGGFEIMIWTYIGGGKVEIKQIWMGDSTSLARNEEDLPLPPQINWRDPPGSSLRFFTVMHNICMFEKKMAVGFFLWCHLALPVVSSFFCLFFFFWSCSHSCH